MKNSLLNKWLWKWHVIAGLITLPFMLLLAITGTIYLFKDNVNHQLYNTLIFAKQPSVLTGSNRAVLPLTAQLSAANNSLTQNQQGKLVKVDTVILSSSTDQNTEFSVTGKGRSSDSVYVNQYSGNVTGQLNHKDTFMFTVRKLHGELLLSKLGTLTVELVASWFIVLILSGLYIWWPKQGIGFAGFFTIRIKRGSRIFWRDIHAVMGFWLSAFMLIILAGGMPWTDVFGSQLKWIQSQTHTGYPMHWRNSKGLESTLNVTGILSAEILNAEISTTELATNEHSQVTNPYTKKLNITDIAAIAEQQQLKGKITINFPQSEMGVYTVTNRALYLDDQQVLHIDQYSGQIIKKLTWHDVGALMNLRQIFMRLHQGEYGLVNWSVLLAVALLLSLSTIGSVVSYIKRKPKGEWGIPKVPERFKVGKRLVVSILLLGIVFPMFGASLLIIGLFELKSTLIKDNQ